MTEKTEGAEDYEKTLDVCSVKFAEDAERNEEIFRGVICAGRRNLYWWYWMVSVVDGMARLPRIPNPEIPNP